MCWPNSSSRAEGGPASEPSDHQADDDLAVRRLVCAARLCLLVALCGAGYLAVVSFAGGAVAGCGRGPGCNSVLSSRWAYWLGLPVSVPGFAVYLGLFAATLKMNGAGALATRRNSGRMIAVLSALVLSAALWFFLLQLVVIKAWCKFCLATHFGAGLAACLLLCALVRMRFGKAPSLSAARPSRDLALSLGSSMLGLALLVGGQVAVKKRLYLVSPFSGYSALSSARVSLHQGKFVLNPKELPLLGSASATNFVVSLFDYTCSHCRALHSLLKAVEARYPGQLGIICLPTPLDATCNPLILITASANNNACEYAKLGLAVWLARREAFREFDDWVFASPDRPGLEQTRAKAEALVGREALDRALGGRWVDRQLQTDIGIYQANSRVIGDGLLPQLVIGDVVTHGALDSTEDLVRLLEQHAHLVRPEGVNTNALSR